MWGNELGRILNLAEIESIRNSLIFKGQIHIMVGILYVIDEKDQKRFVQIDLSIHGELWEDFYDLLIANKRENEEIIPYDAVKEELKKYGKLWPIE